MTIPRFRAQASRRGSTTGRGFLLLELSIAVTLIAILVGLVLPAMQQLLRTHRVRAVAHDLGTELFWVQAEAARRGVAMVLRFKTAADCKAISAGAPLRCGWQVFTDDNEDGLQQANETTMHAYDNPADLTVSPSHGDTLFIDAAGNLHNKITSAAVGISFLVEAFGARPGDVASRRVCINAGNRVRIAPTDKC